MRDFAEMAVQLDAHRAEFPKERSDRLPKEFVWRDPSAIPPRPWLYGQHLIRKQVSVTVAPGGVGKSSLTICEGLAMASGRDLPRD
ncbi:AAA family ATPase [Ruegeria sp. HKCCA4008]|uniref:AAA family ATPase n=1 Tax=Ruegeria sp. HKCCA4008 TaxID=2682999 RepID=UPI0020C2A853|nr:AAA family ATPase [Ruegeria sp. HKCCA4008]